MALIFKVRRRMLLRLGIFSPYFLVDLPTAYISFHCTQARLILLRFDLKEFWASQNFCQCLETRIVQIVGPTRTIAAAFLQEDA